MFLHVVLRYMLFYSRDFRLTVMKMSIKTGSVFFSDLLIYHYSDFWYYRSLLYYEKLKKNREKIRTIYLKIMKVLRTVSQGSNFTGSYKKRVQL